MILFDKKLGMNHHTISKIILAALAFMLLTPLEGEAAEGIFQRRHPTIQKAESFAQQAVEAAKKGDVEASRQHLEQIETLARHPYFRRFIQNSSMVQEAKRTCSQAEESARKAAAEKEESERRAKEKEIAARIAFEKEEAQKRIAQRREDERKAVIRQQQQTQPQVQQSIPKTPQTESYQEGKSFTSHKIGDVTQAVKSTNPRMVPGFQTHTPKEAFLEAGSLGDAALAESKTNEVAQHLHSSAQDRPSFKIDPYTDPLFRQANQATKNPQKALQEQITEISGSDVAAEELKTCEEGGDEYQQTCSKRLQIVLKITPEVRTNVSYCPGHEKKKRIRLHFKHWTEFCGGCRTRVDVTPKKVEVLSERWVDECAILEDHVEKGLCRYVSAFRSPKDETRTIQGEPVTRDHFEEHYQYACFKTSPKSCVGLREKGCFQIKSVCNETLGGKCVLWTQTYSCPSGKKTGKVYRSSNKENPFCLTGDCADTSYEVNNEMMNAMSHLYALRQAQNDLRDFKVIFKGEHRWCTRNCLDFRDCCGSGKGWGVSLHLSSCDAKEIQLRTLRDKNLCVQIGTYCAEKHLGQCTRKKTTFCCYGTKIARLIQQSGRAQLGLGWGSVKSPDCEGLSPDQLSRIDFSKINFSEIFEDIKNQTVSKNQEQSLAQVSAERLQNNMTLLTKPTHDPESAKALKKLKEKGL